MNPALLRDRWLHRSGGLGYHLRALRYSRTLWHPFIAEAARWQEAWRVPVPRLVLVGPSAGYTLSAAFLARFEEVCALEPDPLARLLLRKRFGGVRWRFGELDCFATDGLRLLAGMPDVAVLFSNVIGQLLDTRTAATWREELNAQLHAHHWASYHDVVSTERMPTGHFGLAAPGDIPLEGVLAQFWRGGELPLTDHCTYRLSPGPARYATWSITPRQHHLIEWVTHSPA